jgi:hypothetical protein
MKKQENKDMKFRLESPIVQTSLSSGQKYGRIFIAGASAAGIIGIVYYGLGLSNEDGILEQSELWSEKVRNRINSTYKYVGNGLLITSLTAYFTSKSKKLFQIATSTSVKIIFYFSYKI